jgi:hypothetical protein
MKKTKVALRCSKLPIFMCCPSSAIPVRNKLIAPEPEFNDPGKLGTAVHDPLALMVLDEHEDPELDRIAGKHKVDVDDLAQLYGYGKRCWPMMREHFGEVPVVEEYYEREFPTFTLSGHPDLLSDPAMDVRAGGDWKSGRVEYDASWQLYGARPLTGIERGVIVWLRETWTGQPFEVVGIPPEQEIIDKLTAQVANIGKVFTPGPHCLSMYCERRHECEAYRERVEDSCTGLVKFGEDEDRLPTTEIIARGYHAWKEYEALSKRFKALMNEALDADGEIILPGGDKKLVRLTTRPKVFDAQKTLALMTEYGITDPATCFKVSVGPLEKAIKALAKAAGAKKGAHYAAFLEDCEEAGALGYGERKTRKEVRCDK